MLAMRNGILEWKFLKKIDAYRQREFLPLLLPRQGQNLNGSRCFELVQNSSSCLFSSHSISPTATARLQGPPLPLRHVRACKIGKICHSWLHAVLRRYYVVALFWSSIFSLTVVNTPNSSQILVLFCITVKIQFLSLCQICFDLANMDVWGICVGAQPARSPWLRFHRKQSSSSVRWDWPTAQGGCEI